MCIYRVGETSVWRRQIGTQQPGRVAVLLVIFSEEFWVMGWFSVVVALRVPLTRRSIVDPPLWRQRTIHSFALGAHVFS